MTWPDGELVTPDKLAAWLKEDILLRRVEVPKKHRDCRGGQPLLRAEEQAALQEAEALAIILGLPVADIVQILSNDRNSYIPPASVTATTAASNIVEGDLLTKSTVDIYVLAVIEL